MAEDPPTCVEVRDALRSRVACLPLKEAAQAELITQCGSLLAAAEPQPGSPAERARIAVANSIWTRITGWVGERLGPRVFGRLTQEDLMELRSALEQPRLLAESDLESCPALLERLLGQADPLSVFLWESFSAAARTALADPAAKEKHREKTLIEALNSVLEGGSLYDGPRFAGVVLSAQTKALLAEAPLGRELVTLNRHLLLDAFAPPRNPDDGLFSLAEFIERSAMEAVGDVYVPRLQALCAEAEELRAGGRPAAAGERLISIQRKTNDLWSEIIRPTFDPFVQSELESRIGEDNPAREEYAHEVWVSAWKKLHAPRQIESFAALLRRYAGWVKPERSKIHGTLRDEVPKRFPDVGFGAGDEEEELDQEARASQADENLPHLTAYFLESVAPGNQRAVLEGRYLHELDDARLAAKIGEKLPNTRKLLERGRAVLNRLYVTSLAKLLPDLTPRLQFLVEEWYASSDCIIRHWTQTRTNKQGKVIMGSIDKYLKVLERLRAAHDGSLVKQELHALYQQLVQANLRHDINSRPNLQPGETLTKGSRLQLELALSSVPCPAGRANVPCACADCAAASVLRLRFLSAPPLELWQVARHLRISDATARASFHRGMEMLESALEGVTPVLPVTLATWRDQMMEDGIRQQPAAVQELLRLRLFDRLSCPTVAERLGLTLEETLRLWWSGWSGLRTTLEEQYGYLLPEA